MSLTVGGEKTLKVKAVDQYGQEHKTSNENNKLGIKKFYTLSDNKILTGTPGTADPDRNSVTIKTDSTTKGKSDVAIIEMEDGKTVLKVTVNVVAQ